MSFTTLIATFLNAGVFDADAKGRALFESTDFPEPQAQNFAVTIEPRGGKEIPTMETMQVIGPLPLRDG